MQCMWQISFLQSIFHQLKSCKMINTNTISYSTGALANEQDDSKCKGIPMKEEKDIENW